MGTGRIAEDIEQIDIAACPQHAEILSSTSLALTGANRVFTRPRPNLSALHQHRSVERSAGALRPVPDRSQPMTYSEARLWDVIRDSRLTVEFKPQFPIGGYVADFFCEEARLVIEVDGGHHHGDKRQRDHDRLRTREMRELGIEVLRFGNDEIREQFEYMIMKIAHRVADRLRELGARR